MYLIRHAAHDDASTLLKLAKMVHFINLPADAEIIRAKIARSRKSFSDNVTSDHDREFMFVLEDTDTGNVIGTSSVISAAGRTNRPHTFLQTRKRERYSDELQTGQVHLTLQLCTDESGISEIGGLVIGPSYRGHAKKLGLALSLVRFHFIGRHPDWFSKRIIAEMMGPLNVNSSSEFWESFGRRFINLTFAEADLFCQRSKEFITSLFPGEEIYVSLLSPAARNAIGRVGVETEPALRMLKGVGFEDHGHVDPFDGGPYLEAVVGDIELVKTTATATLAKRAQSGDDSGFVSVHRGPIFRALRTGFAVTDEGIHLPAEACDLLQVTPGDEVAYTPLPGRAGGSTRKSKARPRARSS